MTQPSPCVEHTPSFVFIRGYRVTVHNVSSQHHADRRGAAFARQTCAAMPSSAGDDDAVDDDAKRRSSGRDDASVAVVDDVYSVGGDSAVPRWDKASLEGSHDSVAARVASRVHQASALAELKRKEKLDAVRVSIVQAHKATAVLVEDKVDNYALEETQIMSDGTSGACAWLLTCAMIEGASASEVKPMFDDLVKMECDLNARGNRIQHGKGITPLTLLCSMLEKRRVSPEEQRVRDRLDMEVEQQHADAIREMEVQGALYVEAIEAIRSQMKDREEHFTQTSTAIVDFATALLAAGASPDGTSRMRPETNAIADSRIAPYMGISGTEGSPLFYCALAVISGAGDEVLELASRLIVAGASANTSCSRPGPHTCCGTYLTPLNVLCAALESSQAYDMSFTHKARIAKLGAMIVKGCGDINFTLESSFSHRPSSAELESRRIAPVEVHTDFKGPAIFILACAIAEGAGPPAVALMDIIIARMKKIPDISGSRPHHGRKLPLLTMVIDAIDASTAFTSTGFLETASWWPDATRKMGVSDTGSMLGSDLVSGGGKRRLASVEEDDVRSISSFLPDINDAAFDGQGAIARKEQAERDRLQNLQKTQSEIAAEEARDLKAQEIAYRIAQAEKQANQRANNDDESEEDHKTSDDDGDTESILAKKGATQYTDEDGQTYVVGFTEEMLKTVSGAFGKYTSTEEYERKRVAAEIERIEKWQQMIESATRATFAYIDHSAKELAEIQHEMGLADTEGDHAMTFARPRQAKLDCIDLATQLLNHGANPNMKMQLARECSHQCADIFTTPLNMVAGYISRGMIEVYNLFNLLLEKNADVNTRGLGPYPISCTPLFAVALAIFNGVEGADDIFEDLLRRNVTVDRKALFPGDSSSTALIQLIHALRAGRMNRKRILQLLKMLLKEKGADPNLCCREMYHEEIPAPYLEALKLTNTNVTPVTYIMTQEPSLQQHRAVENAELASLVHRTRDQHADLVPSAPGEHEDLTDGELGKLEFAKLFDEISKLKEIQETGIDDVESVKSSMFGTVANFDFGAPFPSLPPRSGACEYPPLFWVIEAAAKEGHKEALELLKLLLDLGAAVSTSIDRNNHSWIEGSLVAMAVTAAIEAAAPLPPPDEGIDYEQLNVGEVLLRLNQAAKQSDTEEIVKPDMQLPESMHYKAEDEQGALGNVKVKHNLNGELTWGEGARVEVTGGEHDNMERGAILDRLRPPRADNQRYFVDEGNDVSSSAVEKLKLEMNTRDRVIRPEGSRFGHSHVAARRDIPGLVRTTAVVHTSMENRALEITRRENKRREDEIRQKALNVGNNVVVDPVLSADGRSSGDDTDAENEAVEYQAMDTKALDWDIAEKEEKLQAVAGKISIVPKALEVVTAGAMIPMVSVHGDSENSDDANASEFMYEDSKSAEDDTKMDQLYEDVDELGAPSEVGDDNVKVDRAKVPEYVSNEQVTREELELRYASRVKTTMAVAAEIIERCSEQDINQFARNPLLAEYGVGLVPYEYTPLFAALYGAATAKSQEQLATGIVLAKMCINKGARIDRVGLHSMLAADVNLNMRQQLRAHRVARYRELRTRYVDEGDNSALHENLDDNFVPKAEKSVKLRSYPLMWAVTAAIRADSRKLGCEQLVRHMLMEGADPTSISLQPVHGPQGVNMRALHGQVLYLWGTAEDLFRVSQARYQMVMSVRLNIGRMLSECGARSTYRSQTNVPYVTSRGESAGKWLIQGSSGFGIVAPPDATPNAERRFETSFDERITRALHATGSRKQHTTIESVVDRRAHAVVHDQGADEAIATWMWPTPVEAKSAAPPEDDSRIIGIRPVPDYYPNKKLGEIELIAADHTVLDGDKDFIPPTKHSYSTAEAIDIAGKSDGAKEAYITRSLRQMQLEAIRHALKGDESDVPQSIIEDTLLPTKFVR